MAKSLVLMSGGLDSCVCLACAMKDSDVREAFFVDYGQVGVRQELQAADRITNHYGVRLELANIRGFTSKIAMHSTLLGAKEETQAYPGYMPGRNAIIFALAQALAEARGYEEIWAGLNQTSPNWVNATSDARDKFVAAWNEMANYATDWARSRGDQGIYVITPLQYLNKAETIKRGVDLDAPLYLTWTCFAGEASPCGKCRGCIGRAKGFADLGIPDPALVSK